MRAHLKKKSVKRVILRIVRQIDLFIARDNCLCEDVVTFPVTVLRCSELHPRRISWQRLWNVWFLPEISCTCRTQNLNKIAPCLCRLTLIVLFSFSWFRLTLSNLHPRGTSSTVNLTHSSLFTRTFNGLIRKTWSGLDIVLQYSYVTVLQSFPF